MLVEVAVASCYNTDKQDVVTKCFVRATTTSWEPAGLDVDVSSPDRCPFPIPSGLYQDQQFVGIATGDPQYVGSNGYVPFHENSTLSVRVFNRRDPPELVNKNGVTPKNIFGGNPPRSEARVTYTAGTAGYASAFDTKGRDWGYLDVVLRDQSTVAQGRAELTFTYTVATAISGPTSVEQGSNINLATTVSNYRGPLTYKWWKNSSIMSGVTWPNFTTAGPTPGTSNTYKVEITDADGDKGTDTHVVRGVSSSTGGGGSGGCLVLKSESNPARADSPESTIKADPCPP